MSLRHAAALAIVVWYLTYPPFKKNQYGHDRADPTVPLTEWNFYPKYSEPDEKLEVDEEEFFDRAHALEFRTADECEHLRKHFYEEWYGTKGHPGIKDQFAKERVATKDMVDLGAIDSLRFSRCLASDDPRLKGN
jgi:hypothetical protein